MRVLNSGEKVAEVRGRVRLAGAFQPAVKGGAANADAAGRGVKSVARGMGRRMCAAAGTHLRHATSRVQVPFLSSETKVLDISSLSLLWPSCAAVLPLSFTLALALSATDNRSRKMGAARGSRARDSHR